MVSITVQRISEIGYPQIANRGKKWKLWYQRHLRAYYRPVECSLSILLYSQYKGHHKPSVRKKLDQKNIFSIPNRRKKIWSKNIFFGKKWKLSYRGKINEKIENPDFSIFDFFIFFVIFSPVRKFPFFSEKNIFAPDFFFDLVLKKMIFLINFFSNTWFMIPIVL